MIIIRDKTGTYVGDEGNKEEETNSALKMVEI